MDSKGKCLFSAMHFRCANGMFLSFFAREKLSTNASFRLCDLANRYIGIGACNANVALDRLPGML